MSPSFLLMDEITAKLYSFLEPLIDGTDIFIVGIKVKPTNNVKVFLDADSGFSIDKCTAINRKLYPLIENSEMFPAGDFSLEVSSPGVDEPLVQMRQYTKNIGRKVMVTTGEGLEITGMLKDNNEQFITLEVLEKKAKVSVLKEIPHTDIKKTVVQIIF